MTHKPAMDGSRRIPEQEERAMARKIRALRKTLRSELAQARKANPLLDDLARELGADDGDDDLIAATKLAERGASLGGPCTEPCHRARALLARIRRLRNRLVTANVRLVARIASRFKGRGLPYGDLEQEGQLALIHAVNLYDPDRGPRLGTYASIWITRAISRAIDLRGRLVRPPLAWSVRARRLARIRRRIEARTGQTPDVATLAVEANLSEEAVLELVRSDALSVESLDPMEHDGRPHSERLADASPDARQWLHGVEVTRATHELVDNLEERDRWIVIRRFGLDGREPETNHALGEQLGVSGERVRQLQNRAFRTLREDLGEPTAWLG